MIYNESKIRINFFSFLFEGGGGGEGEGARVSNCFVQKKSGEGGGLE